MSCNRTCPSSQSATSERLRRALTRTVLATTPLVLAGCASVLTPLGQEKFDCNRSENPASPYCHSFAAVERGTTGAIPPSRFDTALRMSEHDRLTGIAPVNTPAGQAATLSTQSSHGLGWPDDVRSVPAAAAGGQSSTGAPTRSGSAEVTEQIAQIATGSAAFTGDASTARALEGRPVRQGPLVQRVWVKRFADGNDMLVSTTHLYKEILPTRWSGLGLTGLPSAGGAASSQNAYPHRPPQFAVPGKADTQGKANAYEQPGSPDPADSSRELAPVPASNDNGTNSMPN